MHNDYLVIFIFLSKKEILNVIKFCIDLGHIFYILLINNLE